MAFQPVPEAWEVAVHGSENNGTVWANIYHAGFVSGYRDPTIEDADDVKGRLESAYTSSGLIARIASGWELDNVTLTGLHSEAAASVTSASDAFFGTNTGNHYLPGQIALLVNWYTTGRGRSARGRTYLNGFTEGDSDGRPSTTLHEEAEAWTDLWLTGFNSLIDNLSLSIVSRYHPNPSPPPSSIKKSEGTWLPIVSANVKAQWANQRRRTIPS